MGEVSELMEEQRSVRVSLSEAAEPSVSYTNWSFFLGFITVAASFGGSLVYGGGAGVLVGVGAPGSVRTERQVQDTFSSTPDGVRKSLKLVF